MKLFRYIPVLVISLGCISVSLPAAAVAANPVTVDGVKLEGLTLPNNPFTVSVATSGSVKDVTFVLDGKYLGNDKTAPYQWPITPTIGEHKLKIRVDSGEDRTSYSPEFMVKSGSVTPTLPPVVTPPPVPPVTPPVSPQPPVSVPTGSVINVDTVKELETALATAVAGQTILVADGEYEGDFNAKNNGTPEKPITLVGSRKAVLSTGSIKQEYGLHILGDNWRVNGIHVTTSAKGIILDGSTNTILDGVEVSNIGAEGVHFRTSSSDGAIINSEVHDTGITKPQFGEGIYLGSSKSNWGTIMGSSSTPDRSDRITVKDNKIYNTGAEGIDIKEGTVNGIITGNTFTNSGYSGENSADSWVDVKGNNYLITNNTGNGTRLDAFQAHILLPGWGNNNTFRDNTVLGGVPGYEVWIQQGITGTYVQCGDTAATKGMSNIKCQA